MRPTAKPYDRGAFFDGSSLTYIEANETIRPLRDNLIIELEEEALSAYILVAASVKPLEGIVLAVGPGTYPKRYDHPDKHKRTKVWDSKAYLKTEVKVGDRIKLGDGEITNNSFQRIRWGHRTCAIIREVDIAGIVDTETLGKGTTAERQTLQRRKLSRESTFRGRPVPDVR
jgi:co-chaperonin GroES (HSP10)